MKTTSILTILLLLCASLLLALPDSTEAARMGGGRSFGSKPFMSTPAPAPSRPQSTLGQRPNSNQPQAQQSMGAPRPGGMFGGMGGIFGGLLAGTLIGSLLGGHGFGGGGFMDILIFGLLVFLGLKLFAAFRNRPAQATGTQGGQESTGMQRTASQHEGAGSNGWDILRNTRQEETPGTASPIPDQQISMPAGFDAEEFLRGAKMAYTRLQQSWDKRDMTDIGQFTTASVQEEVRKQMEADPKPGTTEILLVNAQLLGVDNEGDDQYAQVFFDVLLRESPDQPAPVTVREVWHFVRPAVGGGNWKLDGIQQVE